MVTEPLEQLRVQLRRAEKIIESLQEQHTPPASSDDQASLKDLDAGRRGLRRLDDKLEEEIAGIAEREQRRIARDLHDSLGSLLAAADLRLSVLRQDIDAGVRLETESIDTICELLREAITRSRRMIHGLFPVGEDPEELMRALAELAEDKSEHYEIEVRFECPDNLPVNDKVSANHLYRIAQEAVTNAAKHSGGSEVLIRLVRSDRQLVLSVQDNGWGIDADKEEGDSLGLRIMDHRAQTIGGSLSVSRIKPRGTRVVCTVPMPE